LKNKFKISKLHTAKFVGKIFSYWGELIPYEYIKMNILLPDTQLQEVGAVRE